MNLDRLEKLSDQVREITGKSDVSAQSIATVRAYSQELNPDLIRAFISCGRAVMEIAKTATPLLEPKGTYAITKARFLDCQDSSMELDKVLLAMKGKQ